jgi:hypothetical protein
MIEQIGLFLAGLGLFIAGLRILSSSFHVLSTTMIDSVESQNSEDLE